MAVCHLVRVGALGSVGRFASLDGTRFPRASRVIVRTQRGLETGEVLAEDGQRHRSKTDGPILRGMTVQDDLLAARLNKHKQEALAACERKLRELNLPLTLMDAEPLFDGSKLFFYFIGEQPPELETLLNELAESYEAKVQFRQFGETLEHGCGPGCGTDAASGQGCTSCSVGCAVSGACGVKANSV